VDFGRLLADRPQQRLRRVVGCHHDDFRAHLQLFQPIEDPEAVHARHPDVEQHQVELPRAHAGERVGSVLRDADVIAGFLQRHARQMPRGTVIVDDEDGRCSGHRSAFR
jgi:hypothetical protein